MAISKNIGIKELKLDLKNFRTTPQKNETDATMIKSKTCGENELSHL
jgi:hypothetical protein